MGMPSTLKNFNAFMDGVSYAGVAQEVALPKLARKTEKMRAGGMNGEVSIDLGQEPLEAEVTFGGHVADVYKTYGKSKADAVLLRFAGAYGNDQTGNTDAVEVVMRGRSTEIDPGKGKAGDKTELKVKLALTYYKLVSNGTTLIEIDLLNFVEIINGVDMLADQRKALGL